VLVAVISLSAGRFSTELAGSATNAPKHGSPNIVPDGKGCPDEGRLTHAASAWSEGPKSLNGGCRILSTLASRAS
jgi:hypothetical protein